MILRIIWTEEITWKEIGLIYLFLSRMKNHLNCRVYQPSYIQLWEVYSIQHFYLLVKNLHLKEIIGQDLGDWGGY